MLKFLKIFERNFIMSNSLKNLSPHELIQHTKRLVETERKTTLEILNYFREIDQRKLYLKWGFSSLFDFVVKELNYDHGAAGRRIAAMRLIHEIPQVEDKIKKGSLSLTTVSQAAYFFKAEEKKSLGPISIENKKTILKKMEGSSKRECEKILLALAPENSSLKAERVKSVSSTLNEVTLTIDDALLYKLKKVQDLASHRLQDQKLATVLEFVVDVALKKLELKPKKPKTGSPENLTTACDNTTVKTGTEATIKIGRANLTTTGRANTTVKTCATGRAQSAANTPVKKTRYIPALMKRQVWVRDKGACRYKDPLSQRVCGSRKFVQFDHIKPLAKGGPTEVANLRLLCANHNAFMAKLHFGLSKPCNF